MKISLGTYKDKGEELTTFLEPRVGVKPSLSGDTVEIDDEKIRKGVKPRQVKTYVKRFLFMNDAREKYRIFVKGSELILQEIELGKKEEELKEKEEKAKEKKETEKAAEEPEEEKEEEAEPKKPKKAAPKKSRSKKKSDEEE